jgi:hypothetical protein
MLENGLIVEHVDIRREEKEERDRRRKEERRERSRARKSSRASGIDVTSLYSTQSNLPGLEGNMGLMPEHSRPASILSGSPESPAIPRAFSMASFSDVASMASSSPRRSKFFGFKNLSAGWMSQDSLAPSAMTGGSMVDMQCVLFLTDHPLCH